LGRTVILIGILFCLAIMMCGLPSSGKTTWVDNYMNENRAKHFHLIGNEAIMDKMAICGEKREKFNNKHGTPFESLQSTTMGAVLRIMERAVRKKRNYILDQVKYHFYFELWIFLFIQVFEKKKSIYHGKI
jgi:heterogeneous nuclear ribonucleoprotein U-like protein 1